MGFCTLSLIILQPGLYEHGYKNQLVEPDRIHNPVGLLTDCILSPLDSIAVSLFVDILFEIEKESEANPNNNLMLRQAGLSTPPTSEWTANIV